MNCKVEKREIIHSEIVPMLVMVNMEGSEKLHMLKKHCKDLCSWKFHENLENNV